MNRSATVQMTADLGYTVWNCDVCCQFIVYVQIAKIVAWNIWQMDGIKFVVPNSCHQEEDVQLTLFGEEIEIHECPGCERNDNSLHNGIYCRIYDWPANESVEFYSFVKKGALYHG